MSTTNTANTIPRLSIDADGLDFDTLRKEAIDKTQQLSGTIWTDYNLHDPGVTILEQLCYGLTDLSYRAGFDVADYLVNEKGVIDFQQHGLLPPEQAFPSAAVTGVDMQKVLYDAIPEIDYIWLEPYGRGDAAAIRGLYTIYVKIDDDWMDVQDVPQIDDSRLNALADQLKLTRQTSNQLYVRIDDLGHDLDQYKETIGGEEGEAAKAIAIKQKIDCLGMLLSQLDTVLQRLDALWERIDHLWMIITDSGADSGWTEQLQAMLAQWESALHDMAWMTPFDTAMKRCEQISDSSEPLEALRDLTLLATQFAQAISDAMARLPQGGADCCCPVGVFEQVELPYNVNQIKQKIAKVFAQHRQLGEDIQRIEVIQTKSYYLVGQVEIRPSYDPAKVYAEIFLNCAHAIASGIQIERYEAALNRYGQYEQVFSGPLTQHGYIDDHCFDGVQDVLTIVDLIALIKQIAGVVQVHELYLLDQENVKHATIEYDTSRNAFPDLAFPKPGKPNQVLRLVLSQSAVRKGLNGQQGDYEGFSGETGDVMLQQARLELRRLVFEYQAFRENKPDFSRWIQLPQGQRRPLADYYSIQHHFPAVYGINRYGIPSGETPEVKARTKQLKAYLFPFEQLMADCLKNLEAIPQLFSVDAELTQTYFTQYLTNQNIPDIEPLYAPCDEKKIQRRLIEIQQNHDQFFDRRNRVLDTLLALYGETYPQRLLLQLDGYRRRHAQAWIITNKILLLRSIQEITRDRAQGFDYLTPVSQGNAPEIIQNITGVHQRISLLLGMAQFDGVPRITAVLTRRNSRLVPDQMTTQGSQSILGDMGSDVSSVPWIDTEEDTVVIPTALPVFSYSIFKAAADIGHYRLIECGCDVVIGLLADTDGRYWRLGKKPNKSEAIRYANAYCRMMTQLNIACENFYLIEHVLLRPRSKHYSQCTAQDVAFFEARVSVIFPAWTVRFSNPVFRKFAEETVIKHLPAHLYTEFYWLDFTYLQDFEQRYKVWLDCLQQANVHDDSASYPSLDRAAAKVVAFLTKNQQAMRNERWV